MPARGQSHRFGICACACATMFASIMQCTHQLVIPTRSLVVHLCIWTASVDRRSLSFRREASSGRSGRRPGAEAQQDDQLGRHQRHRRPPPPAPAGQAERAARNTTHRDPSDLSEVFNISRLSQGSWSLFIRGFFSKD